MHNVQANTFNNWIMFIIYSWWMRICTPIVGFLTFFTALFFGDYVTAYYNGLDFCQGSFLDGAKNI